VIFNKDERYSGHLAALKEDALAMISEDLQALREELRELVAVPRKDHAMAPHCKHKEVSDDGTSDWEVENDALVLSDSNNESAMKPYGGDNKESAAKPHSKSSITSWIL
jgi:hypothetical protein